MNDFLSEKCYYFIRHFSILPWYKNCFGAFFYFTNLKAHQAKHKTIEK